MSILWHINEMKQQKSPRFPGYDYSLPGAYHITIATRNRKPLLAYARDGQLQLSRIGKEVARAWHTIDNASPNGFPDCFAVMPDHFHGIVMLNLPFMEGFDAEVRADLRNVVRCFKQYTQHLTRGILLERGEWQEGFRLWQTRFYDSVIGDEKHLYNTRNYILQNELAWRLQRQRKNKI
jgi:REP element-mobilizing transposase RayT